MLIFGFLVGMVALVIFLAAAMTVRVDEGELVVLSRFGRALRDESGKLAVLRAGIHGKMPWDKPLRVNLKEQSLELHGEDERTVMTNDGIVVRYESNFRYAPSEKGIENFLFGLARPIEHMVGTFTCLLRNEIANFRIDSHQMGSGLARVASADQLIDSSLGAYALIRRERKTLHERISSFCQEKIGDRYGVRFDAIDVMNFEPPEELRETLNTVMQIKTDVEASLFRAEGECQQRVLAAEKGVEIAKERALAVETEMTELGRYLEDLKRDGVLDAYVARRRFEVLAESRQVYVKSSGNGITSMKSKKEMK